MIDDVAAVERAERQIDAFIESRNKGRDEANALEAFWRASEIRVAAKQREKNRIAWCDYYRRLAACNLKAARDFRRRARELETTEVKEQ